MLTLADIDFDLSKTATVTHFGFMKNSTFNSNKNEEANEINDSYDDDTIDTKTRFPFEGSIESSGEHEDIEHKYHSDEDIVDNHRKHLSTPSLESQHKAHSTPNVAMIGGEEPAEPSLSKKGGIQLDPIMPTKRKAKRKKKKGLQDRVKELKSIEEDGDMGVHQRRESKDYDEEEFLSSSLPPVLQKNLQNMSFDGSKSLNGLRKVQNAFKPDQISLASFGSTANEDLDQEELVLKHLAFRTSDITVSTSIERYKVYIQGGIVSLEYSIWIV